MVSRRADFDTLRRRALEDWLEQYRQRFPCAGFSLDEEYLLCCAACREAEDAWLNAVFDAIPVVDVYRAKDPADSHIDAPEGAVRVNGAGYVKCPGCGTRFSINDADRYQNGMHTSCGQRIRIVD
jgi:hypothetical protein